MSITKRELSKASLYVRSTYFPRWDRKSEWSVQFSDDLGTVDGSCDMANKKIDIRRAINPGEVYLVLIHEIAHAVTGGGHGKRWQARMEKAAQRAENIGETALAESLRKEVGGYRGLVEKVTAKNVYDEVQSAVFAMPEADFDAIVCQLADRYGLNNDKCLEKFPRIRTEYEKAKSRV